MSISTTPPIATMMAEPNPPVEAPLQDPRNVVHYPCFWPTTLPTDPDGVARLECEWKELPQDQNDWLTEELIEEIHGLFPSPSEIIENQERTRCPQAYSQKVGQFFYVGRLFCNFKQFTQAGKLLLDAWAVHANAGAKSLACFYGDPSNKPRKTGDTPMLPHSRNSQLSPKTKNCPFRVSSIPFCRELPNIISNLTL